MNSNSQSEKMKNASNPPTVEDVSEMIRTAFQKAAPIHGGSNLERELKSHLELGRKLYGGARLGGRHYDNIVLDDLYTNLEERRFGNFGEPNVCANCGGSLTLCFDQQSWICDRRCGYILTMEQFQNWVRTQR